MPHVDEPALDELDVARDAERASRDAEVESDITSTQRLIAALVPKDDEAQR